MHSSTIPIWFFIGVLLLVYGLMILGYGLYEVASGNLAPVQLAYLHTPIWWGALLTALGTFYAVRFRPARAAK